MSKDTKSVEVLKNIENIEEFTRFTFTLRDNDVKKLTTLQAELGLASLEALIGHALDFLLWVQEKRKEAVARREKE